MVATALKHTWRYKWAEQATILIRRSLTGRRHGFVSLETSYHEILVPRSCCKPVLQFSTLAIFFLRTPIKKTVRSQGDNMEVSEQWRMILSLTKIKSKDWKQKSVCKLIRKYLADQAREQRHLSSISVCYAHMMDSKLVQVTVLFLQPINALRKKSFVMSIRTQSCASHASLFSYSWNWSKSYENHERVLGIKTASMYSKTS